MPLSRGQGALIRGDACLTCRVRKVKCDGARPVCQRCSHTDRYCQYAGLPMVSHDHRPLEALELKTLELELQLATMLNSHNKALFAHRIFDQFREFGEIALRRDKRNHPPVVLSHRWWPPAPSPSQATNESGEIILSQVPPFGPVPPLTRSVEDELFADWRPQLGVSVQQNLHLVAVFLSKRSYTGFYWPHQDLLDRSVLHPTNQNALHPGLLNSIYLVACSLKGGILQPHIQYFHDETREQLQRSLTNADRISHFLWGNIILGGWLARVGKFQECYAVITSTVRFALGCGLAGGAPGDSILSPPQMVEDAVDRIHLTHAIYQIDRNLAMYAPGGNALPHYKQQDYDSVCPIGALFLRALRYPLQAWPEVLSPRDAALRLDSVLMLRTTIGLLQERVEYLTSTIFSPSSTPDLFESQGCFGKETEEFNKIRTELEMLYPVFPSLSLPTPQETQHEEMDAHLMHIHASYHGTVILLFNIVVMLDALGHGVHGVEVQYARRRTLEAGEALAGILTIAKAQTPNSFYMPSMISFLHFTNAVLVFVRELKRSTRRTSAKEIATWCDSLSTLMDVLQTTLTVVPSWAHLAIPISQLLPSSPDDIDLSTERLDLMSSPVLRLTL